MRFCIEYKFAVGDGGICIDFAQCKFDGVVSFIEYLRFCY